MTSKRTLSAVVAALAATAVCLPAAAGIHYKAVTTTESSGRSQAIDVEAWVDGGNAKVEFRESANPAMPAGTYVVTRDGGQTIYFVNPEEKTYAEWNLDAMLQTLGAMMQSLGPILKLEISDISVEKLGEEAGGELQGLATTHYRYRTTYQMRMKVLGMGRTNRVERLQDIWSTDALTDAGLGLWLRNRPPSTGDPDIDRLMAAEMEKVKGFPLKTVEVATTSDPKGRSSESRSVMEVTELDRGVAVPGATFEIPADYQRTEMTLGAPAGSGEGGEDGEGGNPFKKIFGRG